MSHRFLPLLILAAACVGPRGAGKPATMSIDHRAAQLRANVFTTKSGFSLPYRLFVPPSCSPDKPCGLLLFLHGAGERGSDNQGQLVNDALAFVDNAAQAENPTVVVYPQCPPGMQWVNNDWKDGSYRVATTPVSQPMAAALELLDWVRANFAVDPARTLVSGLSMGGYATWDIVVRQPTLFAGALALCGGGDPSMAATIRDVPVWAFHGDQDQAVPVRGSRQMIAALRQAGGQPRYTEVAGHGHDVWTIAYRDPAVVSWLLSQRRR